jgi:hypothetical protein
MVKPIEINSKGSSKSYALLFGAITGFIVSVLTSLAVTVIYRNYSEFLRNVV